MEVYKLGKDQKIEIQLYLHQLKEERNELKWSLKRKKEIAIEEIDTHYQEIDTTKLFSYGNINEFDAAVTKLIEKN